jgi:hypothetical protein
MGVLASQLGKPAAPIRRSSRMAEVAKRLSIVLFERAKNLLNVRGFFSWRIPHLNTASCAAGSVNEGVWPSFTLSPPFFRAKPNYLQRETSHLLDWVYYPTIIGMGENLSHCRLHFCNAEFMRSRLHENCKLNLGVSNRVIRHCKELFS